jgi:PAS domain S-box-containing protein
MVIIIVFISIVVMFMNQFILARVRSLSESISSISKGQVFAKRLPVQGNDELSRLSNEINGMLIRLDESQVSLRENKQKYSNLVENSNDGIVITESGVITYANPKMKSIVGMPSEKVIGRKFSDLINPEFQEMANNNRKNRILFKPTPSTYEIMLIHSHGKSIPVEISPKLIELDGNMCDMIVIRDITERKRVEAEIKHQKDIIDRIIASTPDSVVVLDTEQRIVLANAAFRSLFNPLNISLEKAPIAEIIPNSELGDQVSAVLHGGVSHSQCDFRFRCDGRDLILIGNVISMQKEVLVLFRDITEQSERQERLYLTDRLASVGEMASGIAHELNNPLTAVVGLSQMLSEEDLPAEIKQDARAVYSEAQRAAKIVKNLLTFARKHPSERHPTQINSVIEDVLKLRAYEHKTHNICVETRLDPYLPLIMADYFQMQQVFLNIVLNAESSMIECHQKGTLTISTENLESTIKITFRDDGQGILKENLDRIFNPFFTTKPIGKGTGLGLSICYGIISSHNGKLYAESEYGQEATFVIELPKTKE